MVRWIKFIFFFSLLSCVPKKGTITAPSTGSSGAGGQAPSAIIHSVVVTRDQLIINGSNLEEVTSVTLTSNTRSAGSKSFKVVSASITQLITEAVNAVEIPTNTALNLILGNAYGQTSFPIDFTVQNGEVVTSSIQDYAITTNKIANATVTLSKLTPNAGTTPTNGEVVTWNGSGFVLAPGGGGGPGGGISSIASGTGIIANPNPITGLGTISVNTGITGSPISTVIPFFNSQGQLVLTGGVSTTPAKLIFGNTNPVNYSIFNDGDFIIREEGTTPKEIFVIEPTRVSINEDLYVNGKPVCVNAGSGCGSSGGSGVTTVTATAPLLASGTTSVNISAGAVNTADNLVKLNGSAQLPAVDGSLLTNIPNMATSAVGANYPLLSGATSKSLIPAGYQMPISACTNGQILKADASGNLVCAADGGGDIVGPASSIINSLAQFADGTGKLVKATAYTFPPVIGTLNQYLKVGGAQDLVWENFPTSLVYVGGAPVIQSNLPQFGGTAGTQITDSGISVANVPTMASDSTGFNHPILSGGMGKTLASAEYSIQTTPGLPNQVLQTDGVGAATWATVGNIAGPVASTPTAIPTFSDATGKNLQNSSFTINGNNLFGGNAVIGENPSANVVLGLGQGCFSHSANSNSGTNYALCQGAGGETKLNSANTSEPLRIQYAGDDQITVDGSFTTIQNTLNVQGVTVFNYNPTPASDTTSSRFPTGRGSSGEPLTTDGSGILSWGSPSDQRLKKEIKNITELDAEKIIENLKVKSFKYKNDNPKNKNISVGFMAQDVLEIFPDAVNKRADGYYTLNYNSIFSTAISVIQSQQKKIRELEEGQKRLEANLDALLNRDDK